MEKLVQFFGPILTLLAAPLILWPSLVLVIALVRQARGAMLIKAKHIAIFIAAQVIWIIVLFIFSNFLILKPLNIKF